MCDDDSQHFSLRKSNLTFSANNLRIAEIRRRVADVFCFRLGEVLVRVYEDELGGEALRKTTRGMNGGVGWQTA